MKNNEQDIPHPDNSCGNGYPDWLEVNLIPSCNAHCSWCVERSGWHPDNPVPWDILLKKALETGRRNVILLGGEPTLYPDLAPLVRGLYEEGRRCWITTNGSRLTEDWVETDLQGVYGVNISIHSHNLIDNGYITGIALDHITLSRAVDRLRDMHATVRLNCNCIRGYVDNWYAVRRYIQFATILGASSVRFAELKHGDENEFVDLFDLFEGQFGTNGDPYKYGCSLNGMIDGMPVNIRQMCGMQVRSRPCPANPVIKTHPVLYYNGVIYNGWQQKKETDMDTAKLAEILRKVADRELSVTEAAVLIDRGYRGEEILRKKSEPEGGGYCVY